MIDLRVLGSLAISAADGRDAASLVRQPKRLALLTYLATATPRGPHRRDRLFALFWPDADAPHARAALNQAIYILRSGLGEDAIISRGDDAVELDRAVVRCDAVAFEAALDDGRLEEALALYRGDLMEGFFISGAPGFEQWLDRERERLRDRAAEGAWALAERLAAGGQAVEAARSARRAAELSPGDEAVARRLMTFLHRLGDRAAAIRAYEAFAWRLSQEYDLAPSPETERLAETIRRGAGGAAATTAGGSASAVKAAPARPAYKPPDLPPPPLATPAARVEPRGPVRRTGLVLVLMLAASAVPAVAWLTRPSSGSSSVTRFALDFEGVPPLASGVGGATIALSPDGSQLVYLGANENGTALYIRPMDRLEATPIDHTSEARLPFFSPDGEWLGFMVANEIRKVPLRGGPAITIATVRTNVPGASWGPDGTILFATPAGLWRVPAEGGDPVPVAVSDTLAGERYRWPSILPDGRAAVFTRVDETGFHLAAVTIADGAVRDLGLDGTGPRFVRPGHLVFARPDGALLAAPFDPVRLRLTGAASPVAERVLVGIAGDGKFGLSEQGDLAYVPEPEDRALGLVDRDGRFHPLPVPPGGFGTPRFSPDGRRIAVAVGSAGGELPDIWVLETGSSTFRRVTFDRGNILPAWTPDGTRIASGSKPGGRIFGFALQWIDADRPGTPETLLPGDVDQLPIDFAPDGTVLLFQKRAAETRRDLWLLPLDGDRVPRPYLRTPADERTGAISPDGRWVAYCSDESGRDEVYVRAFPEPGPPVQVSIGGGREPRWAPNGRELFYRGPGGLTAVALRTAGALEIAARAVLFDDGPFQSELHAAAYDASPDGQHFVMIRRASKDRQVLVVLNGLHR